MGLGTRRSCDKPGRLSRPLVPPGASSLLALPLQKPCAENRPAGAVDLSCGHQPPGSKARNVCSPVELLSIPSTPNSGRAGHSWLGRFGWALYLPPLHSSRSRSHHGFSSGLFSWSQVRSISRAECLPWPGREAEGRNLGEKTES